MQETFINKIKAFIYIIYKCNNVAKDLSIFLFFTLCLADDCTSLLANQRRAQVWWHCH